MAKIINVGGRLHSTEVGNVLTGANEILDDVKGKKQNVINSEVSEELTRLEQSKQDNLTFDNTPTEDSTNPVTSGGVYNANLTLHGLIEAILVLIPSAATALNQLADKNFVNSSIATDTATFRGTSAVGLTEQQFLDWANSLTHDMNDYVFWQTVDAAGNTLFKRYKWDGTQWLYEYTLNNSSFTADQWAAIMSGITAALVEKLRNLPTAAELIASFDTKQDVLTFDNAPTQGSNNPVKSGGIYSAIKTVADDVETNKNNITTINGKIPSAASDQNQLTDKQYVDGKIQDITDLIPAEATTLNQLADMAYVLTKILDYIPACKGQFETLAELHAVQTPKAGDMGIVRTKDSDGYDVFTFYQYLNGQWNVFYTLSRHPQTKPATTGTTGDYPYNGMGRVVIPKKMVNGVNTLTHEAFEDSEGNDRENTIYVIQYDFTLGEDITVPANCVLEFDGGSIIASSAKTITGSNTVIDTPIGKIFNTNIQLIGSWNVNAFIPQWWGAKGDGLNDDTDAIQCAINSIYEGVEDSTQESYWTKPCTSVYIPRPKYGYRITKTISLVEKWNFRFYSDTINVTDRSQHSSDFATFIWDGPTNTPMMLFSYTLYGTVENISLNGKKINGVVGIKLGVLNAQNSSVGNVSFNKIVIMYCSSGVVVGTPGSDIAPDCADIYFRDCIFRHNKYWGIEMCGGNTECSLINCNCGDNGITTNLSENEDGGNIKSYNAETFIYGYISGGNSTHIPKTADIFQYGGGIRIYGAWSDTPGIFLKSTRCTSAAIMSGVRHYEGSMTTENTPVSVKWRGPQALVIEGCYLYNNVEHESGQGGSIVDIGTRFVTPDAGFIGAELSSNPSALTSINNGLKVGNSKLPTNVPSAVIEYLKAKKYITHRLVSDGIGYLSESLNSDGSIYSFMYNAYTNNVGQRKALVAGGVHQIEVGWNNDLKTPTFRMYGGEAANAGDTVSVSEKFGFKVYNSKPALKIGDNHVVWSSSAPSGTWAKGDVCFNSNPSIGNPSFWIHNGTAWISGPLVP